MSPKRAVNVLSVALGEEFRLVGPLAGGETGATEICRADGARLVLKWELDPDNQRARTAALPLAERLRTDAGWPSPQQHLINVDGVVLVTQEFMDGDVVARITHDLVDDILAIHQRRLELSDAHATSSWASDALELLTTGGNGYCMHQPLREFDARTRRIVESIERIGRSTNPADLPDGRIVHGDLHPGNLLQVDNRLSAVIDMDYTRIGDAEFDLTALAVASLGVQCDRGVRTRLFEMGVHDLDAAPRRVYVANMLLRNLDWSIRKQRTDETEFWIERAGELLEG